MNGLDLQQMASDTELVAPRSQYISGPVCEQCLKSELYKNGMSDSNLRSNINIYLNV